jgi:hypothetical protein
MKQKEHMKRNRFDTSAFYAALDAQREAKRLSWRDVAKEAKVNASTLTRLGQGKLPDGDNFAVLLGWLGLGIEPFLQGETRHKAETLACVSALLYNDPCLTSDQAILLDTLMRSTYLSLCKVKG